MLVRLGDEVEWTILAHESMGLRFTPESVIVINNILIKKILT